MYIVRDTDSILCIMQLAPYLPSLYYFKLALGGIIHAITRLLCQCHYMYFACAYSLFGIKWLAILIEHLAKCALMSLPTWNHTDYYLIFIPLAWKAVGDIAIANSFCACMYVVYVMYVYSNLVRFSFYIWVSFEKLSQITTKLGSKMQ